MRHLFFRKLKKNTFKHITLPLYFFSISYLGRSGVRELLKIATNRHWTVDSIHYFNPSVGLDEIDLTQSLYQLKRSGKFAFLLFYNFNRKFRSIVNRLRN